MKVTRSAPSPTRVIGRSGERRVSRAHRTKLLEAAVAAASELEPERVSVKEIVARAELSRGTFYALFADRDACMAAAFEDLASEIESSVERHLRLASDPVERIAAGLAGALAVADTDRRRAGVCLLEAGPHQPCLRAAQEGAARRLEAALADAQIGLGDASAAQLREHRARALHSQILTRLRERLSDQGTSSVLDLRCELMESILEPCLGADQARRASAGAAPASAGRSLQSDTRRARAPGADGAGSGDDVRQRARGQIAKSPPANGKVRLTHRTKEVLESLRANPGASNRSLARDAGGIDAGQISKLLRRLEDHGLISNHGEVEYKWSANSWLLTDRGRELIIDAGGRRPTAGS